MTHARLGNHVYEAVPAGGYGVQAGHSDSPIVCPHTRTQDLVKTRALMIMAIAQALVEATRGILCLLASEAMNYFASFNVHGPPLEPVGHPFLSYTPNPLDMTTALRKMANTM